ncbi:MAG: putative ABC transporter permease [Thermoplasmatota archaeon]
MPDMLEILLIYMLGCVGGYVIELIFRTFISQKKLVNPGFLTGPYLPMYGFGTIILYFLSSVEMNIALRVVFFAVSLTLLELVTGIIFIYHLNIKLWDYSDRRFNFKGLICPLYSAAWTVIGVLFYFLVYPFINEITGLFLDNLRLYFILGIFYGIFSVDIFVSFNLAYKIRAKVRDLNEGQIEKIRLDYKEFQRDTRTYLNEIKGGIWLKRNLVPLRSLNDINLKDRLEFYFEERGELVRSEFEERRKKIKKDLAIKKDRIMREIRDRKK